MNHEEPVCEIERDENGDVFVLVDGMKIAKRSAQNTPQTNTWKEFRAPVHQSA